MIDNRLRTPLGAVVDATPLGDWAPLVDDWRRSPEGRRLIDAVDVRVAGGALVYPADVLRALAATPRAATRVVILGQDPYHRAGQAEGLAFSVPSGVAPPPSLRNVLAELRRDVGVDTPPDAGSLQRWTGQGVLLLNTTLTVEDGRPGSHSRLGWQALTDAVIAALFVDAAPKAFLLWGAHAQTVGARHSAAGGPHLLLGCNHPSPLAATRGDRPFAGSGHFGRAARFVAAAGRGPVDWRLGG